MHFEVRKGFAQIFSQQMDGHINERAMLNAFLNPIVLPCNTIKKNCAFADTAEAVQSWSG